MGDAAREYASTLDRPEAAKALGPLGLESYLTSQLFTQVSMYVPVSKDVLPRNPKIPESYPASQLHAYLCEPEHSFLSPSRVQY